MDELRKLPEEIILDLLRDERMVNIKKLQKELNAHDYINFPLIQKLEELSLSGEVRLCYKEQEGGSPLVEYIGT